MDINSMMLTNNGTRNMFPSPESSAQYGRRSSTSPTNPSPPTNPASSRLSKTDRRRISTHPNSGINEIAYEQWEMMTPAELRTLLLKIAGQMDELQNELRNVTAENLNLKHQLKCRARLRHNVEQVRDCFRRSSHPLNSTSTVVPFDCNESAVGLETANANDDDILYLLPEDLKTEQPSRISVFLSQSMTVLAQINNQEVINKVCVASQVGKQLTIGGIAGYITSHLVRKFGKVAAGSIIGSICFIKVAHHRGYIAVDWNRIQKHIENPSPPSDPGAGDGSGCAVGDDIAWLTSKYQKIREWSRENSYTVLGFWAGFLMHNFQ